MHPLRRAACWPSESVRSAVGLFGLTSNPMIRRLRNEFGQQFEPLGASSTAMKLIPVMLPPGRPRLATRPASTGSPPPINTIGIVEVASFAARETHNIAAPARRDYVDVAADEVGGQGGQAIIPAFGRTVFDCHVLAFDIAGFAQPLTKSCEPRVDQAWMS